MAYRDKPSLPSLRAVQEPARAWLRRIVPWLLSWPLLAADSADAYVLAQPQSSTPSLVAETVDADFIAVPVTLVPSGDDLPSLAATLEKMRTALQAAFKDPYRVSIQPRSFASTLPGAPSSTLPGSFPGADAAGSATGGAVANPSPLLPGGMRFAVLIVRPLNQLDPEQVAFTILGRIKAVAMTVPQCALEPGIYRLGLGDPERLRHDLLLRLERLTELTRICVPKASKAWLSGLEAPLAVSESSDGRQVVVSLPFQLRFEESQ